MEATFGAQAVRLDVHPARVVLIPGGRANVEVEVTHRGDGLADFDLSIVDLPADWNADAQPLLGVRPGERRLARLALRAPPQPRAQPAVHQARVCVVRRGQPDSSAEVALPVIVAVFELDGRVGLLLESNRLKIEPGETVEIPFTISNHGLITDTFTASLEGLPPGWVRSPVPQSVLQAGEEAWVAFSLRAPLGPATQAGARPFAVRVTSRESPAQSVVVDCILEIPEVHQFGIQLLPTQSQAGQSAAIKVQNRGNAPDHYTITWESEDKALNFIPPGPAEMEVSPGSTQQLAFLPHPRRRPVIGGPAVRPYRVRVSSAATTQSARGEVVVKGWLPAWLSTAALFTAIVAALLYLLVRWAVAQPPVTSPTPAVTAPAAPTPTVPPGLTPVG